MKSNTYTKYLMKAFIQRFMLVIRCNLVQIDIFTYSYIATQPPYYPKNQKFKGLNQTSTNSNWTYLVSSFPEGGLCPYSGSKETYSVMSIDNPILTKKSSSMWKFMRMDGSLLLFYEKTAYRIKVKFGTRLVYNLD